MSENLAIKKQEICIKNFKIQPFEGSKFIRPKSAVYEINGEKMRWDFIESSDCVSVFVYCRDIDSFVFVRQFRPPLAAHQKDVQKGFSIELCSGICDKEASSEQIAIEELAEELGCKVQSLEFVGEFYSGFGSGVSAQKLFFADVKTSDFCLRGGGCDKGEVVNAVFVKRDEFEGFFATEKRSALIEFAYFWFLNKRFSMPQI